jgi:ribosomal protein S18 acetylase RimI-like enzyme
VLPPGSCREARAADLPALRSALAWAIEWRLPALTASPEDVIRDTGHGYLLDEWGRKGDAAVVADTSAGTVGAAWYRYWTDGLHSYGFVDAATPELGVGIDPAWRRRGVGTALLDALLGIASRSGIARVSLSVEGDNPAMALYERLGFVRLELVEASWTMIRVIAP